LLFSDGLNYKPHRTQDEKRKGQSSPQTRPGSESCRGMHNRLVLVPSKPLDFSPQSVCIVERVLTMVHDDFAKSGSTDGLSGIALEFAAYLFEVIDRNYGPVEWRRDDPEFGPDSFPLIWRDRTLFPFAWCEKRIFDGPGDNVWTKFITLVQDRADPESLQTDRSS